MRPQILIVLVVAIVFAAVAVLAGQYAVATLTFPGVALYAGGLCAMAAMLLLIVVRPQVLGLEARSALARLVPGFGRLCDSGGQA